MGRESKEYMSTPLLSGFLASVLKMFFDDRVQLCANRLEWLVKVSVGTPMRLPFMREMPPGCTSLS